MNLCLHPLLNHARHQTCFAILSDNHLLFAEDFASLLMGSSFSLSRGMFILIFGLTRY